MDILIISGREGIEEVRRVVLPIEVILAGTIINIFTRLAVRERHVIHGLGVDSLVNKSSPLFGQHGHLGLRDINGNSVHVTLGVRS